MKQSKGVKTAPREEQTSEEFNRFEELTRRLVAVPKSATLPKSKVRKVRK